MLRRFALSTFAAIVMTGATSALQAQATCGATGAAPSCSPAGVQVTTTLGRIIFLSITPASFTLTAPTNADFVGSGTTKKVDLGAHVGTVRANAAWTLTLQGAAWTGTGNNAKAVGDLEYTKDGGTTYATATTAAVSLQTGIATAASTVTVGYRTTWTLTTDSPGTYTMPLTYTLSSP